MSDSSSQDRSRLARGFRAWVEEMAATGVDGFPLHAADEHARVSFESRDGAAGGAAGEVPPGESLLVSIREDIGDCRRCKLCHGRTHIVFGVGNAAATVMFVGEGPGEDEDRKGEPFVGRAGQLLTDIITNGMGLRRSDVYIANVVKCRPPGNRNPQPDEIAACQPFLSRQIEAISPKVVVALGKFAAQTLLQTTTPISRLRGQWHQYGERRLMPTFHPSYLLRNPADKRLVWQDIQSVMRELDLPIPKPARGARTRS